MNEDGTNDRSWVNSYSFGKKIVEQKKKIAEMEFENGEIGFNLELKSDNKV